MIVQNILDIYKAEENYIINSMIVRSYDEIGCVFQWLSKNNNNLAAIRKVFIGTTGTEILEERNAIIYIEI